LQGFSTNPRDPTDFSDLRNRKAPLFEFQPERLKRGPNGFFVYFDPYRKAPYAYFSHVSPASSVYNPNDCSRIGSLGFDCGVVKPYKKNQGEFINPNGWQIISAGMDGKFGPGDNSWGPTSPVKAGTPGTDDLANFAPGRLGKP
jgi:hypothetical protein